MLEQRHEDLVRVGLQALLDDDMDFLAALETRYNKVPGSRRFWADAQIWLKVGAEASAQVRAQVARTLIGLDLDDELDDGGGDDFGVLD